MGNRLIVILVLCGFLAPALFVSAEHHDEIQILNGKFFEQADDSILHVEMVGVHMIIKLLDEDSHPAENAFVRGIMTVKPKSGNKERIAIQPIGDGMALQRVKTIRKRHLLKMGTRLFTDDPEVESEVFNFFYNQHRLEAVTVKP